MLHFLYKTTNIVNGRFYIGVHSTENENDGYLGSGTYLKKAIKKYGKESFSREILKYCESIEELYSLEREVVTEEFVLRRDTYNSEIGGRGGKVWDKETKTKMSETISEQFASGRVTWNKGKRTGNFMSTAVKEQLSVRMSGSNNHMYGINVSTMLTLEEDKLRRLKISEANKKPKLRKEKYSEVAKRRKWIVHKSGEVSHLYDDNDPRLQDPNWKLGRKWN